MSRKHNKKLTRQERRLERAKKLRFQKVMASPPPVRAPEQVPDDVSDPSETVAPPRVRPTKLPGRGVVLTCDRRTHDRWMHRDRFALQALKRKVAAVWEKSAAVREDIEKLDPGGTLGDEGLGDVLSNIDFYTAEIPEDYLATVEPELRAAAKQAGRRVGDLANERLAELGVVRPFPQSYRDGSRAHGERRAVFRG